jgi:hypothetical protein
MPDGELLRTLLRGSDQQAALQADRNRLKAAEAGAIREALARLAPFTRTTDGVYVGDTPGRDGQWLRVTIPFRIALALSLWIVGTPGAGKTVFLLWLALLDLLTPNVVGLYYDYQGSESGFSTQLLTKVIPGLIFRLGAEWGAKLLSGLRVIAPWQSRKLPSLHVTAPGGNVNLRAASLVDIFAATTTVAGGTEFGPRMLSFTMPHTRMFIRLGIPFPLLATVMPSDSLRTKLAAASGDESLIAYMRDRCMADYRDAGAAVLSRIDRFLADDTTRLACFAPEPLDATESIEHGITIANFGGGPAMNRAAWTTFTQKASLDAIIARRPTKQSPRIILRIDEAQVGLPSTLQAREIADAVERMRGRRAALAFAHQHGGQLSEYPFLKEALRGCCGTFATFRVPPHTFAESGCGVPDTLLPGMDRTIPPSEVHAAWERVIDSLPKRTFLLRAPDLSNSTIPVRTPDFDVDEFARGVPRELVELVSEGQLGYDRDVLAARETTWLRVLAELATVSDPNVDALNRLARGNGPRARSRGQRRDSNLEEVA